MDAADLSSCSDILLRTIEEYGLAGGWRWTFASDEQRWSPSLFRLLGLDPSSVTASYDLLVDLLHPDDRVQLASPSEVVQGHVSPRATVRVIRPSGEVRILSVLSELRVSREGRPLSLNGVVLDITDRERLHRARAVEQRRLRALYRTTYATSYMVAPDRTHDFPPEMSHVHGISLPEIRHDPFAMIVPEERAAFRERAIAVLSPQVRFQGLARERLANGEVWQFRIIGVPLWDEAGRYEGRAGMKYPIQLSGRAVRANGPVAEVVADRRLHRAIDQTVRADHLRAARGLLDWSRGTLAEASGLSLSTVRRLEENEEGQGARSRHRAVDALRRAGIRFIAMDDGTLAVAKA